MSTEHKFRMNISAEQFSPTSITKKYYVISLVLIILMTGSIFFLLPYLPKQIPLYFTETWGEARLASKISLLILPSLAVIFMLTNLILTRNVKEDPVLSRAVAMGNVLMTTLLCVSYIGIVQSIL